MLRTLLPAPRSVRHSTSTTSFRVRLDAADDWRSVPLTPRANSRARDFYTRQHCYTFEGRPHLFSMNAVFEALAEAGYLTSAGISGSTANALAAGDCSEPRDEDYLFGMTVARPYQAAIEAAVDAINLRVFDGDPVLLAPGHTYADRPDSDGRIAHLLVPQDVGESIDLGAVIQDATDKTGFRISTGGLDGAFVFGWREGKPLYGHDSVLNVSWPASIIDDPVLCDALALGQVIFCNPDELSNPTSLWRWLRLADKYNGVSPSESPDVPRELLARLINGSTPGQIGSRLLRYAAQHQHRGLPEQAFAHLLAYGLLDSSRGRTKAVLPAFKFGQSWVDDAGWVAPRQLSTDPQVFADLLASVLACGAPLEEAVQMPSIAEHTGLPQAILHYAKTVRERVNGDAIEAECLQVAREALAPFSAPSDTERQALYQTFCGALVDSLKRRSTAFNDVRWSVALAKLSSPHAEHVLAPSPAHAVWARIPARVIACAAYQRTLDPTFLAARAAGGADHDDAQQVAALLRLIRMDLSEIRDLKAAGDSVLGLHLRAAGRTPEGYFGAVERTPGGEGARQPEQEPELLRLYSTSPASARDPRTDRFYQEIASRALRTAARQLRAVPKAPIPHVDSLLNALINNLRSSGDWSAPMRSLLCTQSETTLLRLLLDNGASPDAAHELHAALTLRPQDALDDLRRECLDFIQNVDDEVRLEEAYQHDLLCGRPITQLTLGEGSATFDRAFEAVLERDPARLIALGPTRLLPLLQARPELLDSLIFSLHDGLEEVIGRFAVTHSEYLIDTVWARAPIGFKRRALHAVARYVSTEQANALFDEATEGGWAHLPVKGRLHGLWVEWFENQVEGTEPDRLDRDLALLQRLGASVSKRALQTLAIRFWNDPERWRNTADAVMRVAHTTTALTAENIAEALENAPQPLRLDVLDAHGPLALEVLNALRSLVAGSATKRGTMNAELQSVAGRCLHELLNKPTDPARKVFLLRTSAACKHTAVLPKIAHRVLEMEADRPDANALWGALLETVPAPKDRSELPRRLFETMKSHIETKADPTWSETCLAFFQATAQQAKALRKAGAAPGIEVLLPEPPAPAPKVDTKAEEHAPSPKNKARKMTAERWAVARTSMDPETCRSVAQALLSRHDNLKASVSLAELVQYGLENDLTEEAIAAIRVAAGDLSTITGSREICQLIGLLSLSKATLSETEQRDLRKLLCSKKFSDIAIVFPRASVQTLCTRLRNLATRLGISDEFSDALFDAAVRLATERDRKAGAKSATLPLKPVLGHDLGQAMNRRFQKDVHKLTKQPRAGRILAFIMRDHQEHLSEAEAFIGKTLEDRNLWHHAFLNVDTWNAVDALRMSCMEDETRIGWSGALVGGFLVSCEEGAAPSVPIARSLADDLRNVLAEIDPGPIPACLLARCASLLVASNRDDVLELLIANSATILQPEVLDDSIAPYWGLVTDEPAQVRLVESLAKVPNALICMPPPYFGWTYEGAEPTAMASAARYATMALEGPSATRARFARMAIAALGEMSLEALTNGQNRLGSAERVHVGAHHTLDFVTGYEIVATVLLAALPLRTQPDIAQRLARFVGARALDARTKAEQPFLHVAIADAASRSDDATGAWLQQLVGPKWWPASIEGLAPDAMLRFAQHMPNQACAAGAQLAAVLNPETLETIPPLEAVRKGLELTRPNGATTKWTRRVLSELKKGPPKAAEKQYWQRTMGLLELVRTCIASLPETATMVRNLLTKELIAVGDQFAAADEGSAQLLAFESWVCSMESAHLEAAGITLAEVPLYQRCHAAVTAGLARAVAGGNFSNAETNPLLIKTPTTLLRATIDIMENRVQGVLPAVVMPGVTGVEHELLLQLICTAWRPNGALHSKHRSIIQALVSGLRRRRWNLKGSTLEAIRMKLKQATLPDGFGRGAGAIERNRVLFDIFMEALSDVRRAGLLGETLAGFPELRDRVQGKLVTATQKVAVETQSDLLLPVAYASAVLTHLLGEIVERGDDGQIDRLRENLVALGDAPHIDRIAVSHRDAFRAHLTGRIVPILANRGAAATEGEARGAHDVRPYDAAQS